MKVLQRPVLPRLTVEAAHHILREKGAGSGSSAPGETALLPLPPQVQPSKSAGAPRRGNHHASGSQTERAASSPAYCTLAREAEQEVATQSSCPEIRNLQRLSRQLAFMQTKHGELEAARKRSDGKAKLAFQRQQEAEQKLLRFQQQAQEESKLSRKLQQRVDSLLRDRQETQALLHEAQAQLAAEKEKTHKLEEKVSYFTGIIDEDLSGRVYALTEENKLLHLKLRLGNDESSLQAKGAAQAARRGEDSETKQAEINRLNQALSETLREHHHTLQKVDQLQTSLDGLQLMLRRMRTSQQYDPDFEVKNNHQRQMDMLLRRVAYSVNRCEKFRGDLRAQQELSQSLQGVNDSLEKARAARDEATSLRLQAAGHEKDDAVAEATFYRHRNLALRLQLNRTNRWEQYGDSDCNPNKGLAGLSPCASAADTLESSIVSSEARSLQLEQTQQQHRALDDFMANSVVSAEQPFAAHSLLPQYPLQELDANAAEADGGVQKWIWEEDVSSHDMGSSGSGSGTGGSRTNTGSMSSELYWAVDMGSSESDGDLTGSASAYFTQQN
ncbi:hypothetical protein CYMTET_9057 [Cymbomonas tetramitiformis]|uniref:Uncharacterized protein n=1 Tax=Cymbomonas tetramitiformis TaxID=36881 RepID=A0AAE0GTK5_9CHLO|nr:hypothetical protein CYMTET_9057 [Cymbomonas tetramitiformis]